MSCRAAATLAIAVPDLCRTDELLSSPSDACASRRGQMAPPDPPGEAGSVFHPQPILVSTRNCPGPTSSLSTSVPAEAEMPGRDWALDDVVDDPVAQPYAAGETRSAIFTKLANDPAFIFRIT